MSTPPQDRTSRQAKIAAAAPRPSRLRPILITVVAVVVVLAVAAAVWLGVRSSGQGTPAAGAGYPRGATGPTGGISTTTNPKPGAHTLDVYEDFQCPACEQAEAALGPTIKKMAADGDAKVVYHVKSFLDANLNNDSSKRAALAGACAADAGKFQGFHDALYAAKTPEGQGFTDATLEKFATQAGISGDALATWRNCYSQEKYADYVKGVEDATARANVNSTPQFWVDGKAMDLAKVSSADGFRKAVLAGGTAAASTPATPTNPATPSTPK